MRDADRRRQESLLSIAGHRARRADAGRLAADRPDEGPGRRAGGPRHEGHVHQQHAGARRAEPPAGRHGRRPLQAGVRRARAVPQLAIRRGGAGQPAAAAGDRRGALRERVGPRFPTRLRAAGAVSRVGGQSADDRLDGHGHRRGAPRHRRNAQLARAADFHHRLRAAEPVLCRRALPHRPRQGRRPIRLSRRDARLGHRLCLDAQAVRGARRAHRSPHRPGNQRLSRRAGARPAPRGPGRLHAGPHRDRRGHAGLRHGHRQERHSLRRPLQPARQPRSLLPGGRPRGPRRPDGAVLVAVRRRRPQHPRVLHRKRLSRAKSSRTSTTISARWGRTRSR